MDEVKFITTEITMFDLWDKNKQLEERIDQSEDNVLYILSSLLSLTCGKPKNEVTLEEEDSAYVSCEHAKAYGSY